MAYDPLAGRLPPHVTLIFPFASSLAPSAVEADVREAVAGAPGRYVFLPLRPGNDAVIALHDRLYAGALAPCRSRLEPCVRT